VGNPLLAVGVVFAAGATDVLDGWLARRLGQATALGAVVDPVADKVFAISVVVTLLVHRMLPLWAVPALLVREVMEAPLIAWIAVSPARRAARAGRARANLPGKLATAAQLATVLCAIVLPAALPWVIGLSAATGAGAGGSYWSRELRELAGIGTPRRPE
jgi:cardiolipin synthase (CMP-forming)